MKAAANGLPESILLLNDTLKVRWANATAYRELGVSHKELSALDFRRVLPQIDWPAVTSDMVSDSPLYMDDLRRSSQENNVTQCYLIQNLMMLRDKLIRSFCEDRNTYFGPSTV